MNWPWRDGAGGLSVAILVVVALLLALPFVLDGLEDERLDADRSARGDRFERAEVLLPRRFAGGAVDLPAGAPIAMPVPIEPPPPVDAATSRIFSGFVTEIELVLHDLKGLKTRPDEKEDRLARRVRREQERALETERLRLDQAIVTAMRRDPALAFELLVRTDGDGPEDLARHLARLLRQVDSPALGAELLDRLRGADEPRRRSLALVALESARSPLAAETALELMENDPDPALRDQAAEFLGRGLIDPLRREEQATILGGITGGLGSEETERRLRSLRALRYLRHPDPRTIEVVAPLRDDLEPRVREEAALLWRLWRLEIG